MRLMRFHRLSEPSVRARLGVLLAGNVVGDLRSGYARYLADQHGDGRAREVSALRIPPQLGQLLQDGRAAWEAVRRAADWLASRLSQDDGSRGDTGLRASRSSPLLQTAGSMRLCARRS
jgi:hypothetical protein